jgi:hypothetical protein
MDASARGELVLTEMGEDASGTNPRARDFRYQHAEKSRQRWPALPFVGEGYVSTGSRPSTRAQGRGSLIAAPFKLRAEMDAKTIRRLVFLAALSLFCSTVAWAVGHAVFASIFFALGAVAAVGAAGPKRPRR